MGALACRRNLAFGMIGVGEVFRMFRDGVLDGDDEVALAYDRESYTHYSEPLVNIRRAWKWPKLKSDHRRAGEEQLVEKMKVHIIFPTDPIVRWQSCVLGLRDFFERCPPPDVKAEDARQLLLAIRSR